MLHPPSGEGVVLAILGLAPTQRHDLIGSQSSSLVAATSRLTPAKRLLREALRFFTIFYMVTALLVLAACDGKKNDDRSTVTHRHGILTGQVLLAKNQALPRYNIDQMRGGQFGGQQSALPSLCPSQSLDGTVVKMVDGRRLSGALVSLTGFQEKPKKHKARVHIVKLKDCRLDPPLIVAALGDTLMLRNETKHTFLPRFGTKPVFKSVPYRGKKEYPLEKAGVHMLSCGVGAPCGRVDVVVLRHRLATKTDEHGLFRLEGVPRRQRLVAHAWHPLFQEGKKTFALGPDGTKDILLTIKPAPKPDRSGSSRKKHSGVDP